MFKKLISTCLRLLAISEVAAAVSVKHSAEPKPLRMTKSKLVEHRYQRAEKAR